MGHTAPSLVDHPNEADWMQKLLVNHTLPLCKSLGGKTDRDKSPSQAIQ